MWNYHSIHENLAWFSLPWQELCRREGKLPCSPSRGLTHISHLSWCLSFLLDWDNKCSFSKEHQQQNSWTENVKHLWDILFDTFWKYTSIPEEWEHSVWQSMRVYLSSADVASEERERERESKFGINFWCIKCYQITANIRNVFKIKTTMNCEKLTWRVKWTITVFFLSE